MPRSPAPIALCIQFPKDATKNPLKFEWKAEMEKAHRRGKIGWDVGKHIEVIPHFRRPHMTLVWTGSGRAVPKIVPRRGSIVHREAVEKLPSGWEGEYENA
jgi:hypothetical protein